jgi:Raf kinase inhibitor-like YbhB/YbcL family protein
MTSSTAALAFIMASTTLQVSSSAFGHGSSIPVQFTAEGDDIAPPLTWSPPPPGAKTMAILVEDPDAPNPDAPTRTFVHWIVTGIPAVVTSIDGRLPDGAVEGTNDGGQQAWMGPNPPIGRHRYFFRVFALDIELHGPGMTKPELLAAMKGHVLAQGELIGTYENAPDFRSELRGMPRTHPRGQHR